MKSVFYDHANPPFFLKKFGYDENILNCDMHIKPRFISASLRECKGIYSGEEAGTPL